MQTKPWILRGLKGHSVHYSEMKKVEEPQMTLSDAFTISTKEREDRGEPVVTSENCRQLLYPRVLRARKKVKELENSLQNDMLRKFDGLSIDQRKAIINIVEKNIKLRNKYKGHEDSDSVGSMIAEIDTEFTTAPDSISMGGPRASITTAPRIQIHDGTDDSNRRDSLLSQYGGTLHIPNFHVESYLLISEKEKNEEDTQKRKLRSLSTQSDTNVLPVNKLDKVSSMPARTKYAKFIDKNKGQRNKEVDANINHAYQHMSKVVSDLDKWVHDSLESTVTIQDPLNPPKSPPANTSNVQFLGSSGNPSTDSDQTSVQISAIERKGSLHATNGAFDILLNACKPSILETSPPIKLKVSLESNPPASIVQSIKKNLGVDLDEHLSKINSMTKNRGESIYGTPKAKADTTNKYGSWYVRPSMWNEIMEKRGEEEKARKLAAAKHRKLRGVVQQKLHDITQSRLREEAIVKEALSILEGKPANNTANTRSSSISKSHQSLTETGEGGEQVVEGESEDIDGENSKDERHDGEEGYNQGTNEASLQDVDGVEVTADPSAQGESME